VLDETNMAGGATRLPEKKAAPSRSRLAVTKAFDPVEAGIHDKAFKPSMPSK